MYAVALPGDACQHTPTHAHVDNAAAVSSGARMWQLLISTSGTPSPAICTENTSSLVREA
jgi:hypothetical protein